MSVNQSAMTFPKEYRGGLFRTLDKDFAVIFGACLFVLFVTTFILSHRPLAIQASASEVAEIQERYARLVLNVKKPEPEPEQEEQARTRERAEKKTEEKKPTVDRKEESLAERRQRKEQTSQARAARRQQLDRKIASAGIFAAITASSDISSESVVQDLLGTGDVTGDISDLAMSGQTFAKRTVDVDQRRRRRETRASGGTIAQSKLQEAAGSTVSRRGTVGISDRPQDVQGDAKSNALRTHAAIGKVIKRQQTRLRYVYEKWLKKNPALAGKLLIRFTITPSGRVTNVIIASSTTGNPDFDKAIIRYVKRWKFSAISEGAGSVTVVYPFVFSGTQ